VAADDPNVAEVAEVPRLDLLLALVVVYVHVVTIDVRQDKGHAPTRRRRPIHVRDPVAIDGLHFVVMARDLPDPDAIGTRTRLVQVHVFELEVEQHSRLGQ
jgi:hypothetical protein